MPWGDYGNILFRGFLNVMDEEFHDLVTPELERTGPYVPDIYIANTRDLVIRDEVKIILEECGVTGIESYREIKKKKIVRLDWENWDQSLESPQYYPSSGKPENYIIRGIHDEFLAESLPKFWNPKIAEQRVLKVVSKEKDWENFSHLKLCVEPSFDIVCSLPRIIVSERLKGILEVNDIHSVSFIPIEYK